MNTVPTLDKSQEQQKLHSIPRRRESTLQPQISQQTQPKIREDKYIELLKERLITLEDFVELMGIEDQCIQGY